MKLLLSFCFLVISSVVLAGPFKVYNTSAGLINNSVNCIEQGKNFLWVGTNGGLNRVVYEGDKLVKFSPRRTSVPVNCLTDDGEMVWVGLKGRGVYRMPKKNYKFLAFRKDLFGEKEIIAIKRTANGVDITTAELIKYSFEFGKEAYKESKVDPIKSNVDYQKDGKHILINKGELARYNEATKSYRSLSAKFKANSGIEFKGQYLMATNQGLVYYNSKNDTITFGEAGYALKNFSINGVDTTTADIDLNWDEYIFNFDFKFMELGASDQITITYELIGADKGIQTVKGNEGIVLKDLEHGNYQLKVKGVENSLGVKSNQELTYSFSIANPLKDSIWQYLIIAGIGLVWTILIIVITQKKYKKDILVLEDALLEKTNRLNKIEMGKYGLVEEEKVNI